MLLKQEIEKMVEQSYHKLYQVASPAVRYYLLTEVKLKGREDRVVQQTFKELETYPPRARLLHTLREDGTWPIPHQRKLAEDAGPGPPVGWTMVTMLRNLQELSEYFTPIGEGRVMTAIEKLLSWQTPEGYIPGPTADGFPMPQYNGSALRNVCVFGLAKDPCVKRLVDWLLRMQRPDGGWVIPYVEDVRYLPEYRNMKMPDFLELVREMDWKDYDPKEYPETPSCIWTTMMVVRGMYQTDMRLSREVRRGADFFLDRFFKRNYHPAFYQSETNWTRLKYPTYFGSGICALDLLQGLNYGPDDPRLDKPVRWLMSQRSKDGFWSQSARPDPYRDHWITAIALLVLSWYGSML